MIGCVTVAAMSILFGLSTNIEMALVARLFLGLFNPIWSTAKTLVSELCSREHEARAMGLTAGCWSLGMVFGPMLGGLLANPAKLYPDTFGGIGIFEEFPYLLPNLVTAGMGIAACGLVYVFLPETLYEHVSGDGHMSEGAKPTQRGATIVELLNTPGVTPALTAYFVLCFIDLSFNEIVPLWAISSQVVGGLSMEQKSIGFLMTFTGCLLVVYTFVLYPLIVEWLGRVYSYRIGQVVFIPFCLSITLLSHMSLDSPFMFPLLVIFFAVAKACCSLGNSSLGLIINRSVAKEKRASINGLSMGVGSASKAIGPMVSAYIFAWSISGNGLSFPFDYHLIYIILAGLAVVCVSLPLVYKETDHTAPEPLTGSSEERDEVEMKIGNDVDADSAPLLRSDGYSTSASDKLSSKYGAV